MSDTNDIIYLNDEPEQELDPLTEYNEGIAVGVQLGRRSAWNLFDPKNESTWPEIGKPFIALWKYPNRGEWYGCEYAVMRKEGEGYVLHGIPTLEHRTWMNYWIELPDPNDYEA